MTRTSSTFGATRWLSASIASLATAIGFTMLLCSISSAGAEGESFSRLRITAGSIPSAATDMPGERIRHMVLALEYTDKTARDLVEMAAGWKDARGQTYIEALARDIASMRRARREGRVGSAQLVQTELAATRALGHCVKRAIAYESDYFDLAQVIAERKANCFGYSQLFYLLGDLIGLSVGVVSVIEPEQSPSTAVPGHIGNIVSLSDGTTAFVDLTRASKFVSEPFPMWEAPQEEGRTKRAGRLNLSDAVPAVERPDQSLPMTETHIVWAQRQRSAPSAVDDKTLRVLNRDLLVAEIHFSRGTLYNLAGQDAEALWHYNKAIELSPQCARAFNNRGAVYLSRREYNAALADFREAVELNPEFAQAHQNRGSALLGLGDHAKAIAAYTEAIRLFPKFSDSFFCRGFTRAAMGQYAEGIRDYTRAIELNPQCARAYYQRGVAHAQLGLDQEARSDLAQAVELDRALTAKVTRVSDDFELGLTFN